MQGRFSLMPRSAALGPRFRGDDGDWSSRPSEDTEERCVGHVPPDQTAATDLATKAVPSLSGVTSSRSAVNHLLKSVVREICTLRSVGTGGGRPPPVTRWVALRGVPL